MALTQVTSAGLKDGEIVNADLHSSAAIALSKLGTSGSAGSGNFLRGDGAWTAISLDALNASNLTSGTVAAARLDTATTQSAGNNSTKIATTAYADTAVSNLVDSAPGALNTLNELAAALGDDASFSTTVTNSIATKLPLAGGTLSGDLNVGDNNITNVGIISVDKIQPDASTVLINMGTDKNISFSGSIGEIGNVTGFQTTNDAQSANTSFGIRATDVRFATGSTERFRVTSSGNLKAPDDTKIELGGAQTGSGDLQIYHDGSHSYITNTTGDLKITDASSMILATNSLRLRNGASAETYLAADNGGGVALYHNNTEMCYTNSDGMKFEDSKKITFGSDSDTKMYHDNQHLYINNYKNNAYLMSPNQVILGSTDTNGSAQQIGVTTVRGGAVKLYYANSTKLETTDSGVKIVDAILEIADTSCLIDLMETSATNHRIRNGSGNFYIQKISDDKSTTTDQLIIDGGTGVVQLNHNGSKRFETTSAGCDVTGTLTIDGVAGTNTNSALNVLFQTSSGVIDGGSGLQYNPANDQLIVNGLSLTSTQVRASGNGPLHLTTANANGTVDLRVKTTEVECNGHFVPGSNNADNLGSSSLRWANLYINDLQLSNKGSSNSVDGTWGDWTLQEGEEDLFMINNRSGKKYKMALQEVS